MSPTDAVVRALGDVVGPEHILTDADMVAGYVRDWTGRWTGRTLAVVRPGSLEEVRAVVGICNETGVPLVPQGGNTGLVGGSVPHHGEALLSLRRLDRLGPVDLGAREVTVGGGATIAAVRAHARESGLEYGIDLASRDSATVGGTIATNAGGTTVVAYGDTRAQVIGLEVVFADGSVGSSLEGLVKESTGPDPLRLMVGSEGTLGVITAARLRLHPRPVSEPMVVLVGVGRLSEGLSFVGPGVRAVEFFDRACLAAVIEHRRLPAPLDDDHAFYVLIESEELPELPDGVDAVVDRRLWAYRESITETINQVGVPVKLDVAVPVSRVDDLAEAVGDLGLGGRLFLFGHLVEGNFHVNVTGSPDPDEVEDRVLQVVSRMGGAIASEHGIGVAKAVWWRRTAGTGILQAQRRIKDALDPNHTLNPEALWRG